MKILVTLTRQENADHFGVKRGSTVAVDFEGYIAAVVASEFASGGSEASKAQAIAARTFAVGHGVLDGKPISDSSASAQAYRADRCDEQKYPRAVEAARATEGLVLTYKGAVISAVYTQSNGGRTVSAKEAWGSARPYLPAQDDPWDAAAGYPRSGHGVGMSQCGARWAGAHGVDYKQILSFYYPGTEIEPMREVTLMRTREEVDALRESLLSYGASKPEIVARLAEECLGWPYVFGAWGEDCTPSNRGRRVRSDHPTIKSKCPALNGGSCADCQWGIGVRMYDCRGFTAWLLKQVGIEITGGGATSQWKTAANWAQRGEIRDMPDCVCCVFQANGSKMAHTGMHVGGGRIIHCSSGVQIGQSSDKGWTHWAIPVGLYDEGAVPVETVKPLLKKGSRGDAVRELQETLNRLGYDCGSADGIFGEKTRQAVERFQRDHALTADGIVGQQTWRAIDAALSERPDDTTYRVTIDGVTWAQYRRILEICPLAEAVKEE